MIIAKRIYPAISSLRRKRTEMVRRVKEKTNHEKSDSQETDEEKPQVR